MSKFTFNTPTSGTATGGGLFGSPANTSTQATSGPQQTTLNFFGFGSKTNAPAATTTPGTTTGQQSSSLTGSTSFGTGFGAKQTTLSFGQPGASTTTTASPFGTTNQAANTSFSFGQTPATTTSTTTQQATASTGFGGFGGFGSSSTTTQPAPSTGSTFGGFGTQTTSTTQPTGGSLFSFNQPQPQPQTSLFGSQQPVAATTSTIPAAGQQGVVQPPTSLQEIDHLMNALVSAQVFNDERDQILAKWNQLQAFYGTGKIFYQNMSIDATKDNRLNRFKTIGYSCKPGYRNEDGLVCLILNKKEQDIRSNQKTLTESLFKIFTSDQSYSVKIDSIKQLNDDKTEVIFCVEQRLSPVNEAAKTKVPAMQVFQHLNKQEAAPSVGSFTSSLMTKPTIKQQLEQLGVTSFYPLVGLTDEQIKNYLDKPPAGFDHALWDQGKKKNPNPKKLLPVQIVGFSEINKRFKLQDQENHAQKISINLINDKIEALNTRNSLIRNKIEQFKARNEDLEQRILKVLINYEMRRKSGIPMQENEKYLSNILDSYDIELNSPINKEIREQKLKEFNEVIKQLETSAASDLSKRQTSVLGASNGQLTDIGNLTEVQKSLKEQQLAFKSLIEIINQDLKDLNTIKRGILNEK